jgi:hypothetical protein
VLLLYALAKNLVLVHLFFMAVSIRTARLLLLYALAKVDLFATSFYKML